MRRFKMKDILKNMSNFNFTMTYIEYQKKNQNLIWIKNQTHYPLRTSWIS